MSARLLILILAAVLAFAGPASADTLSGVKARGSVICGTTAQTPGVSATRTNGNWTGLGADFCRGLAAVIFNDPEKVQFALLTPDTRIAALTSGQVDVLADLLPWTLDNDT